MTRRPDDLDLVILDLLQDRGRITLSRLAAIVGRSLPAVSTRIRRLEDEGFIVGFYAALNHHRLARHASAFILVHLQSARDAMAFAEFAESSDEILEDHELAGSTDHFVKVRTFGTVDLQSLLRMIENRPGVVGIEVDHVTRTYKESRRIPVRTIGDFELRSNALDATVTPGSSAR